MVASLVTLVIATALAGSAEGTPPTPAEARVSLDLKDAPAVDIVSALAEVGRLQVVFDPGPACSLTLKVRQVRWRVAFESALRAHAAEMAPIVKRLLAPRGDVVYDARTNTLIIVD